MRIIRCYMSFGDGVVYQKFLRAPRGQTVGVAEPKLTGHTRIAPT